MLVLVPLANVVNLAVDGWGYICRLSLHWTLGLRTSLNQYPGVPTVSTNVLEFQQSQPMSWSSNSLNQCPGVPTVSTNVLEFQQSQPHSNVLEFQQSQPHSNVLEFQQSQPHSNVLEFQAIWLGLQAFSQRRLRLCPTTRLPPLTWEIKLAGGTLCRCTIFCCIESTFYRNARIYQTRNI